MEKLLRHTEAALRDVDQIAEDGMREVKERGGSNELVERIKSLRERCRESVSAYLRLVAIAGLAFITPAHAFRSPEDPDAARKRAAIELEQHGITSEQQMTYVPGVNDLVLRSVEPFEYKIQEKLQKLIPQALFGRPAMWPEREDIWRLYLGIPQEHGTFGISDYTPANFDGAYCYKIKGWFDNYMSVRQTFYQESPADVIRDVAKRVAAGENRVLLDLVGGERNNVMGRFYLDIGEDEHGRFLYYYDLWDLDIPMEQNGGFLGKPLVIYDRLYFDPNTFEPLQNLDVKKLPPDVVNIGVM